MTRSERRKTPPWEAKEEPYAEATGGRPPDAGKGNAEVGDCIVPEPTVSCEPAGCRHPEGVADSLPESSS